MLSRHLINVRVRVPRSLTPLIRAYAATNPQTTAPPPSAEQLETAATGGVRFTPGEVAEISRREQSTNPDGRRVHGGPSSTAQSILAKQQQLETKMQELEGKPVSEITEKDVGELHSAMTKGRGGVPLEKNNIVSDLHKVAQANEGKRDGTGALKE
jgi:hypothetical protein